MQRQGPRMIYEVYCIFSQYISVKKEFETTTSDLC